MARGKPKSKRQLLRWTEYVPASEVLDPLGLSLRGSARLASLLLFCITSITPRARYFSFIPWCISHFQVHEKGKPYALGLKEAICIREKALTYGCVALHGGKPCEGGALVGSDAATKWLAAHDGMADLMQLPFAKNPALNAYLNSLVNLGFFESQDERTEVEEDVEDAELTFDDIELSELGRDLASAYGSSIGRIEVVKHLSGLDRTCRVENLKRLGERGGLCELTLPTSLDRDPLRSIFFARSGFQERSHDRRRRTLTLILELCRQFSDHGWLINSFTFGSAVYFRKLHEGDGLIEVTIPDALEDISNRWRMFYFHHFMSVALEGLFSCLVTQLIEKGITGTTIPDIVAQLDSKIVARALRSTFALDVPGGFGSTTPSGLFAALGISSTSMAEETARAIDETISVEHAVAEPKLEDAIRSGTYRNSPTGLAISVLLLGLTLGRYRRWEASDYGGWLASDAVVKDPYLDLLPSTVLFGLDKHLGDWWTLPWSRLLEFVLSRFIVQQHQSMSFEKTAKGDRCLIQVDGSRISSDGPYEQIGLGNGRLRSAVQVLIDLAFIKPDENGVPFLTEDGMQQLQEELVRGEKT
jgi:hypothetical protein